MSEKPQKNIGNRQHYKFTRLCSFYQAGICSRGQNCSFAHSELQIRAQPDFYKTRLCDDFRRGKCTAGEACQFAHGSEEMKRLAQERRNLRKSPLTNTAGGTNSGAGDVLKSQTRSPNKGEVQSGSPTLGPKNDLQVNGISRYQTLSEVAPHPSALPNPVLLGQGNSRRSSTEHPAPVVAPTEEQMAFASFVGATVRFTTPDGVASMAYWL